MMVNFQEYDNCQEISSLVKISLYKKIASNTYSSGS